MGYAKGCQLTNRSFFQNAGAISGAPSAAGAGSSSSWGSPNSPALRAELPAAQHRPAHGPSGVLSDNLANAAVLHVLMSLAYAHGQKEKQTLCCSTFYHGRFKANPVLGWSVHSKFLSSVGAL